MIAGTKHHIPVLDKTFRVLHALAEDVRDGTSSGIARRLGISQSTCYRILRTLEASDWIRPREPSGYEISLGLLPIVRPLLDVERIGRRAQDILDRLAADLQLTVKLVARQGRSQVGIAVGQPRKSIGILAPVGLSYPVVIAASGAALLSDLTSPELEKLIATTPPDDWRHDNPEELRRRVAKCRRGRTCENIGFHPAGIDAIARRVKFEGFPLALTLIGLRGEITEQNLPKLRRDLAAATRDIEQQLAEEYEERMPAYTAPAG